MNFIRFYKNYSWENITIVSFSAGLFTLIVLSIYGIAVLMKHSDCMEISTDLVQAKTIWDLSKEIIGATMIPCLIGEILLIISGIKRKNDSEK